MTRVTTYPLTDVGDFYRNQRSGVLYVIVGQEIADGRVTVVMEIAEVGVGPRAVLRVTEEELFAARADTSTPTTPLYVRWNWEDLMD